MSTLAQALCNAWLEAKAEEEAARIKRLAVEQKLCEVIQAPEEGQKTHKIADLRCTRTNGINYKVDMAVYPNLAHLLPEGVSLLKPTTNETVVKALRNKNVQVFAKVQDAILMSPKKPNFEIVRLR